MTHRYNGHKTKGQWSGPILVAVLLLFLLLGAGGLTVHAQSVEKQNYMTDDQYAALGFQTLKDPAAFSEEDTSNPLSGYTANILSELLVGQMNRDDNEKDYVGSFQIMENAKTASPDALNLNNMAKTIIGKIQGYIDANDDDDMYTQCKNTIALRPGKLSETTPDTKDIIIEDTLYCLEDGWFYEDDSYQGIMTWTMGEDHDYTAGTRITKKLDDGHWVGEIEVRQADGLTAMAVGDFDGDDFNEVAVHCPENGGGIIRFYQPVSDGKGYKLQEEKYTVSLGDIGKRFKVSDDLRRPMAQLTTTRMAGRDDLAISLSLPYSNTDQYCDSSALAIYSFQNGKASQCFNNDLVVNNNEYRFKFPATANADLNGDSVDELVVAGNKNYSYKNKDTRGNISTTENLVNVVLYNGSGYELAWSTPKNLHANELVYSENEMNAPVTITGGRYNPEQKEDTLFCEGVYYTFAGGAGETANAIIKNGTLACNADADFQFAPEVQDIKNANGVEYIRAFQPFIGQAVTAGFVEDSRTTEQTVFVSGTDSRNTFSNTDWVDMDIAWIYNGDGGIVDDVTNALYVDSQDEDDNGTLLTLCAINVDKDTVYTQYQGKNVGWSSPSVQSIMLSTPYWSELDYGNIASARGSTTYGLTVSNGDSRNDAGNIGLGLSYSLGGGAEFLGTGASMGFSVDASAAYTRAFQSGQTHSDTLSFTGYGGSDMLGLTVTPVAIYNYKVWVPEHPATQADVDAYAKIHEGSTDGAPAMGDTIPGQFGEMAVSVQMNPVEASVPVESYNRTIREYNQTAKEDEKIDEVDIRGSIYPGIKTGDPTTYASDTSGITASTANSDVTVAQSTAGIGMNGTGSTTLGMSDTYTESTSNGYTVNIKAALTETIKAGLNLVIVNIGEETKLSQAISGGWSQTWTTTTSRSASFSGTLPSLPASAQTGTGPDGNPTSAYAFSTTLAEWNTVLGNGETLDTEEGETIYGKAQVLGYLVDGTDGSPKALPTDLHVLATTTDSAVLAWTPPADNGRRPGSYKVYYSKDNASYQPVKRGGSDLIVKGDSVGCVVGGLLSDTQYYFRLEAYGGPDATGDKSVLGPYAQGKTKAADTAFAPIIDTPPVDLYKNIGDSAEFSITAHAQNEGDTLSYQWQKLTLTNYAVSWKDIDTSPQQQTDTFNAAYFAANGLINASNADELDGSVYRCVVTETAASGNQYASRTSRAATLHIGEGQAAALTLTIPEQTAVVDQSEDGQSVTALPGRTLNLTGSLTGTLEAIQNGDTAEGLESAGLQTAEMGQSMIRVHLVNDATKVQTEVYTATTDAQGNYAVDISEGLPTGSYTLTSTYLTDGETKTTWSSPISLEVLDVNTPHSITYELNGGTNAASNPEVFTLDSGVITLADAGKLGATFTGWYRDAALTQKVTTIDTAKETGDLTLYAGWQNIDYAITYELEGGTNASGNPAAYTVDDRITLEAPTKAEVIFAGWYTDAARTQPTTGITPGTTGDITFYAKWESVTPADPPVDPDINGAYPISNYEELVAVAQAINVDPIHYANADYYLTGNINGDGKAWTLPIGSEAYPFTGSFDGRDYYILSLEISGQAGENQGLFDTIGSEGSVKNLSVVNLDWNGTGGITGGLAAVNKGTITGCGSGVNITTGGTYFENGVAVPVSELNSDVKGECAGGLVGINQGTILDCRSNAVVHGETAGGITAENTGIIRNVYNTGAVTGSSIAGGIVGSNTNLAQNGYSNQDILGDGAIGAIAGSNAGTLGKFYYVNTMAQAVGSTDGVATQGIDDEHIAMAAEAMRSQTFCDMLNADIQGQDQRQWTSKASENGGYPRIMKSVLVSTTLVDPLTGIQVTGSIHPDATLQIRRVAEGDASYQALVDADRDTVGRKAYALELLYADGTRASFEGKLTVTFPVDWLGQHVRMQVEHLRDGRFAKYGAAIEDGRVAVTVEELGTFGLTPLSVASPSADEAAPNAATGITGQQSSISWVITLVLGTVLILGGYGIHLERKRRGKRDKSNNE